MSGQALAELSPGPGHVPQRRAAARSRGRRLAVLLGWYSLWVFATLFCWSGVAHQLDVGLGYDSHAYWGAWRHGLYDLPPLAEGAYLYSPAFAQVVWPFTLLSWPVFQLLWIAVTTVAFLWLLAPLPARWRIPVLLLCVPEVLAGNVYSLLAVTVVLGLRRPGFWAFALLTKILPGGVGLLWFLLRRQWRDLSLAVGVTAALALVSAAVTPGLWWQWVSFLLDSGQSSEQVQAGSVPVKAALGVLLVVAAAVAKRPWLLAPAMVLLSPTFGPNTLTILAAVPRLAGVGRASRRAETAPALTRNGLCRPVRHGGHSVVVG